MQLSTKRWLLSPVTQWRACRFLKHQRGGMTIETAWILVRLRRNPTEANYAIARSFLAVSENPGLKFDDWSSLPQEEKDRRCSWLRRHGRSPFQQLGISEHFLLQAGISVTDWGPQNEEDRD
ncbi:hypothetical protein GCM10018793_37360 [Streptomyces sulfonofaciens]|uniref:Uncharacterized protein n=1 Tax=Streptomyces sulfonofaciens TaxID=68272 RepID=A0A919L346_9ACTN|nr:hypothetical protein GCM10018793_37360 [Streptomyces sulfonofaciens]